MHRKPFSTPPKASLPTRMGPVLSMLLVAVIVALHGAGPSAWANGHAPWPPAPVYELHQKEIPKGTDYDGEHYEKHIEYSLTFEDQAEPVFLARAYIVSKEGSSPNLGFFEQSFALDWLNYGTLLHASWQTEPVGSGSYTMNSNLLLLKFDGIWRVLFRDTHFGHTSGGGISESNSEMLGFSFEPESNTLVVQSRYSGKGSSAGKPFPLGRQWGVGREERDNGVFYFGRSYEFVRTWPCRVIDGHLRWNTGTLRLMIDGVFPTANVVAFLNEDGVGARTGLGPDIDWDERLQRLNPNFEDAGACWDNVLLDEAVAPYAPDEGHYYLLDTK